MTDKDLSLKWARKINIQMKSRVDEAEFCAAQGLELTDFIKWKNKLRRHTTGMTKDEKLKFWSDHVHAKIESGLSRTEYCRNSLLSVASFTSWESRIHGKKKNNCVRHVPSSTVDSLNFVSFWVGHTLNWASSGLSSVNYCANHKLLECTFLDLTDRLNKYYGKGSKCNLSTAHYWANHAVAQIKSKTSKERYCSKHRINYHTFASWGAKIRVMSSTLMTFDNKVKDNMARVIEEVELLEAKGVLKASFFARNRILELESQLNWLLNKVVIDEAGVSLVQHYSQLDRDKSLSNLTRIAHTSLESVVFNQPGIKEFS